MKLTNSLIGNERSGFHDLFVYESEQPLQTYNSYIPAAKAGPGNPHTHTRHSSPHTPGGSSPGPLLAAPQRKPWASLCEVKFLSHRIFSGPTTGWDLTYGAMYSK